MPNTLAHLGIQGVVTRRLIRGADMRWVFVGCVVPDIPFIIQRIVAASRLPVDLYDLRVYTTIQASLAVSLLLSAFLAALSSTPRKVFLILGAASIGHLLLDAVETKWANGVHVVAPFSWELWNVGLFWPESAPIYLLTGFGFIYAVREWIRPREPPIGWAEVGRARVGAAAVFMAAYLLLPLLLLHGPESVDNHSVATLRDREARPGRLVEFDRNRYRIENGEGVLRTFAREDIRLVGAVPGTPARLSVRGVFLDESTVYVIAVREHALLFRNVASYLGLGLVALVWILPARRLSDAARAPWPEMARAGRSQPPDA